MKQNYLYPINPDYNVHITGVSVNIHGDCLQFIFSNGERTAADDLALYKSDYKDHFIE